MTLLNERIDIKQYANFFTQGTLFYVDDCPEGYDLFLKSGVIPFSQPLKIEEHLLSHDRTLEGKITIPKPRCLKINDKECQRIPHRDFNNTKIEKLEISDDEELYLILNHPSSGRTHIQMKCESIHWKNIPNLYDLIINDEKVFNDIGKYTGYFHDGGLEFIVNKGRSVILYMLSCEVWDTEPIGEQFLSSDDRFTGRLIVIGITRVTINGVPFEGDLQMIYDSASVLDLDVYQHKASLGISWMNFPPRERKTDWTTIDIEAVKIVWESVPDLFRT